MRYSRPNPLVTRYIYANQHSDDPDDALTAQILCDDAQLQAWLLKSTWWYCYSLINVWRTLESAIRIHSVTPATARMFLTLFQYDRDHNPYRTSPDSGSFVIRYLSIENVIKEAICSKTPQQKQ